MNRAARPVDGVRGYGGEVAMEYDWFWVILAVGVFTMVAIVPLELALEAYWRWREPRRNQREREIAGRPL
jgi:hypothetical protein